MVFFCSDTRVPVKTVQLGEPVTFDCALPIAEFSQREIYWYKQRPGDTLRLIVKVVIKQHKSGKPEFEPDFLESRWKEQYDNNFCRLTILKTNHNDDGLYHCAIISWKGSIEWTGTYLIVTGKPFDFF